MATSSAAGWLNPSAATAAAQQPSFRTGSRVNGHLVLQNTSATNLFGDDQGADNGHAALVEFLKSKGLYDKYAGSLADAGPDGNAAESGNGSPGGRYVMDEALKSELKNYSAVRTSTGGRGRQWTFVDNRTGQVAGTNGSYGRSAWWEAPRDAAVVLGSGYLAGAGLAAAGAGSAAGIGGTGLGATGAAAGATTAGTVAGTATNAALIESAVGTAGYGASSASAAATAAGYTGAGIGGTEFSSGGAGAGGGGGGGLGSAGGATGGYAPASNAALAESAVGTPGYGASSAGAGGGAGTSTLGSIGQTLADKWNALTPQQQMRLGGSLASAVAGGFGGASSSGGSGGGLSGAGGAADQQMRISQQQLSLADSLRGQMQGRQTNYDAQFDQILGEMLSSQRNNNAFSNDLMAQYRTTYMPAAQRMADTAANYDTAGRREAAGAEAVAGVDAQFARQREGLNRDLGRAGISMDSGRALTLDNANRFGAARAAAGADRVARQGVEDRGIALTQGVVNQGNQVGGLALNAGQAGTSAGSQAAGTLGQQQGVYNATVQPVLSAYQGASSATNSAGGLYDAAARTRMGLDSQRRADNQADAQGWGQLIGTLGSLYYSDPKTKHIGSKVSGEKALRSLEDADVHHYKYRKGFADEGKHIGRMAGAGDPKGLDGLRRVSVQDELGKHHAAIKELSRQVKRLSLEDATEHKKERA